MIYAENIFICIAAPLLVSLLFLKGGSKRFVFSFLLGMGCCLLSAYISTFFGSLSEMTSNDISIYISPVTEEIMKILPILFILFVFELSNEELLLSVIGIGVGFASFENCCYILSGATDKMSYMLVRGFSAGVMHLVSMLTMGYSIGFARKHKVLNIGAVVGTLALASTFHALYNLLVSEKGAIEYIGFALPITTAFIVYFLQKKRN